MDSLPYRARRSTGSSTGIYGAAYGVMPLTPAHHAGPVGRDTRLALDPEPPGVCRGVASSSADPDARPAVHPCRVVGCAGRTDEQIDAPGGPAPGAAGRGERSAEVQAGMPSVQREGGREAGRAPAPVPRRHPRPTLGREAGAGDDLAGSDEHRLGSTLWAGDQTEQPVHAVGEVDVGLAGRPEHRRGPRRLAPVGVRPGVVQVPGIRLGLGDPHSHAVVLNGAPEKGGRDGQHVSGEEVARQPNRHSALPRAGKLPCRRDGRLRAGELLADSVWSGAAVAVPGRQRPLDAEHVPHARAEVRAD